MKARQKRAMFILLGVLAVGAIAALVLTALQSNINLFFSPTQVAADEHPKDRTFRLGGLVEPGSIEREDDGLTVYFKVTDNAETVRVTYTGILPDLFREGEGVVAQGKMGGDGLFRAEEVLAKHDETYMPPEVAEALEEAEKAKAAEAAAAGEMGAAAPVTTSGGAVQ